MIVPKICPLLQKTIKLREDMTSLQQLLHKLDVFQI